MFTLELFIITHTFAHLIVPAPKDVIMTGRTSFSLQIGWQFHMQLLGNPDDVIGFSVHYTLTSQVSWEETFLPGKDVRAHTIENLLAYSNYTVYLKAHATESGNQVSSQESVNVTLLTEEDGMHVSEIYKCLKNC